MVVDTKTSAGVDGGDLHGGHGEHRALHAAVQVDAHRERVEDHALHVLHVPREPRVRRVHRVPLWDLRLAPLQLLLHHRRWQSGRL